MSSPETRPPLPPFTLETAIQKVRLAEDAWNSRDPRRVSLAYTPDTVWRNRAEVPVGREKVVEFLTRKWNRELDYRLIKELWAFRDNRIAVRFAYEWHDDSGSWFRSYGNENWEFDAEGLMQRRFADDLVFVQHEQREVALKIRLAAPLAEQRLIRNGLFDKQTFLLRHGEEELMQPHIITAVERADDDGSSVAEFGFQRVFVERVFE